MIKVLFLGSKKVGYECLLHLIKVKEQLSLEVIGVLSNDNNRFGNESLIDLAKKYSIKIYKDLDDILSIKDLDYIISVQYHKILKSKHIDVAKKLAINLHMAPLPELRGCNQFSFAILNDYNFFGTTIHKLESGIDNGAIISERRFPTPSNCFVKDLVELTIEQSIILFKETIKDIINNEYRLINQSDLIEKRGSTINYRKDIESIKKIDLNQSEALIYKQIRATAMPGFEFPYSIVNGMKIYLIPEQYL